ncbi:MAG TPA: ABC transporter ATP-binding protein [Bacillales bacterium]
MEQTVSMQNVSKHYDGFSLKDVSLTIPRGYITGLVGPNGSGKTTLIKLIMNLIHADSGAIRVFGKSYTGNEREIKANIGFVYDEPGFYQDETVKGMKDIVAPFYDTWDERQFEQYRERFQLPLRKKIKKLSKGMKMKFSLALALSHNADFIVMDEPTSGLDPIFRRELTELLSDIMQNENKTILFSTHITAELDRIADFITYINNGEIVFSREKDDIIESFALVKGPNAVLKKALKDKLAGFRQTEVGFEGVTDQMDEVEAQFGDQLVIEKPSMEDIMFYYSGRET